MQQLVSENDRVALFIDVDNILICAQNAGLPFGLRWIVDRVRQEGTLMTAKAYADWSAIPLQPFLRDFQTQAIELVQLGTTGPRMAGEHKNTADIQLAVDALEMVMSSVQPRTVAVVSGDRDFVPLVQKLKRYGTRVIGIGVEGSVSPVLAQACDIFVYYGDLVPPADEEIQPSATAPDLGIAHGLLRRAVEALVRDGRQPTEPTILGLMRQLDPTFDLSRFRTTFKDLAFSAQKDGYVAVEEREGLELLVSLSDTETATVERPQVTPREYDFSTPTAALASYRTILQENRIPLLPWFQRRDLLSHLWSMIEERGVAGLSMDEMRRRLLDYAGEEGFDAHYQAIEKFLYSLSFARCFTMEARPGHLVKIPEEIHVPLTRACGEDGARRALNNNYVNILVRGNAQLNPPAVVALLLDNAELSDLDRSKFEIEVEQLCDELQPPTALTLALREAQRHEINHTKT